MRGLHFKRVYTHATMPSMILYLLCACRMRGVFMLWVIFTIRTLVYTTKLASTSNL